MGFFWGGTNYVFCMSYLKYINHLFFHCSLTRRIWKELLKGYLVSNPSLVWDQVLKVFYADWYWGCYYHI